MTVIAFPDILRPMFTAVNGAICQRSDFGAWEALTDLEAARASMVLRQASERHERDGERALAKVYDTWLSQLTMAWQATERKMG